MHTLLWNGASALARRTVAKAEDIGVNTKRMRNNGYVILGAAIAVGGSLAARSADQAWQAREIAIVGQNTSCTIAQMPGATEGITYQGSRYSISAIFAHEQDNKMDVDWSDNYSSMSGHFTGYALPSKNLNWTMTNPIIGSLNTHGLKNNAVREITQRAIEYCSGKYSIDYTKISPKERKWLDALTLRVETYGL